MSTEWHMAGGPTIEFVELSTELAGKCVLDRVSLSVPAGQTTVIMGPSGVGKTTLLRHLLHLAEPDSGSILLDSRSVWNLTPHELTELRNQIGVLLGGTTVYESSLFGSFTAFDNVAAPLQANGLDHDTVEQTTWELLRKFDLADAARRFPDALSAGTRRRVALAKALIGKPTLLVLDDPDPAIDALHRNTILQTIADIQTRTKATVVLTTHSIALAKALGDHLAVLLDGNVVAAGPIEELLDGVDNADEFDDRFHFKRQYELGDVEPTGKPIRRPDLVHSWVLAAILILVAIGIFVWLISTVFDSS